MIQLLRLGLVFLFLLLPPGAFLVGGCGGNVAMRFDISRLPDALVVSIEEKLAPRVLDEIQPVEYLMRHLTGVEGLPATVYVAFYTGYGTTGAHDPVVCFPSQGWDLSRLGHRVVPLLDDESLTAQIFRATQGRDETLVVYWFQPAGRWPRAHPEELFFRVYDAISGRKRYAFVRLTTPFTSTEPGSGSAEERLVKLAREMAPWVRNVLEGVFTAPAVRNAVR